MRASIEPHHVMYLDEPWHLEAAMRWLATGRAELCESTLEGVRCTPYPKSKGMVALLLLPFALFGARPFVAFATTTCLGVATVPLVAWIARRLGASATSSLVPAAVVAFSSLHATFSVTTESNVPGTAFAALALALALPGEARRRGARRAGAVAAALIATALRPEASLLFVSLLPWVAARDREEGTTGLGWRSAWPIVLALPCAAWIIAPAWSLNERISGGGFFDLRHLATTLRLVGRPEDHLALLPTTLAFAGLGVLVARSRVPRTTLVPALAAGTALALLLPTYERFQPRMALLPMVLLLPFGAFAVDGLAERLAARWDAGRDPTMMRALVAGTLVGTLAFVCAEPLEAARHPPATQRLERRLVDLVARTPLPADAPLVTEWPTVLATAHTSPATPTSTWLALDDARLRAELDRAPVIFVCDMHCEPGYAGGAFACPRWTERVLLAPLARTTLGERAYGLHRVVGLRPKDAPPAPPCTDVASSPATGRHPHRGDVAPAIDARP